MGVGIIDDGYDDYETERFVLARLGTMTAPRPCRGEPRPVAEAIRDAVLARRPTGGWTRAMEYAPAGSAGMEEQRRKQ